MCGMSPLTEESSLFSIVPESRPVKKQTKCNNQRLWTHFAIPQSLLQKEAFKNKEKTSKGPQIKMLTSVTPYS